MKLFNDINKIILLRGAWGFIVLQSLMVPFFQSKGMSLSNIFWIQSLFAFFLSVAEIPSGYFADKFGAKNSIVLGGFLRGFGAIGLVLSDSFWGLSISYVFIALANSFVSGSDISLMYHIHKKNNSTQIQITNSLSNLHFIGLISVVSAAFVSSVAIKFSLDFVVILNAICAFAALLVSFLLPSDHSKAGKKVDLKFKEIIPILKNNRNLIFYLGLFLYINFIAGFSIFAHQILYKEINLDMSFFGVLFGCQCLFGALFTKFLGGIKIDLEKHLPIFIILLFTSLFSATLPFVATVFIAALLLEIVKAFSFTIILAKLNHIIPHEFRATLNSIASFASRILLSIFGPLSAYLCKDRSFIYAFYYLIIFSLVVFFVLFLFKKIKNSKILENENMKPQN